MEAIEAIVLAKCEQTPELYTERMRAMKDALKLLSGK